MSRTHRAFLLVNVGIFVVGTGIALWATFFRPFDSVGIRVLDGLLTIYLGWNVIRRYRVNQRAVR